LAFQLRGATPASTVTRGSVTTGSITAAPRRPTWRRARIVFAGLGAGLLLLVAAVPAGASWPVASRHYSYVSQYYHSGHPADDIAAPAWTRIVPIASGKVVFAGWKSNCGGYQVWVSHGNGTYTAYYHMIKEISYRGEWVTRSTTTLGWVGRSGCATGYHTHVEVWRGYPWASGSYRVNPWSYIDSGTYLPYRYR
jgi:murein DD-endopeptidase MepM/ murein hydrolase activator NlpD